MFFSVRIFMAWNSRCLRGAVQASSHLSSPASSGSDSDFVADGTDWGHVQAADTRMAHQRAPASSLTEVREFLPFLSSKQTLRPSDPPLFPLGLRLHRPNEL